MYPILAGGTMQFLHCVASLKYPLCSQAHFCRMLAFQVFEEMPSPSQHVPVDDPMLKRPIVRIAFSRGNIGITINGVIDHRELLHLLLIGPRSSEVLLKQHLSLLPS